MKAILVSNLPQVAAGDMRNKLQPGAAQASPGELGRPGRGGHLQPMALHGPQADFTILLLSVTPELLLCPAPKTPPPSSARGSLQPWAHSRNSGEEEPRKEEDSLHLQT